MPKAKSYARYTRRRARDAVAVAATVAAGALTARVAPALAGNTWDGGGTTNNWTDDANWNPDGPPVYGVLTFSGSTRTTNTNDYVGLNMNGLSFNSAGTFTVGGNAINFFDNGGLQAKIENNGSAAATVNLPVVFAATAGTPRAEINAVTGDLTFGTTATVSLTGSAVNGLELYGTGRTLTLNGVVSGTGKYVAVQQGNVVVFGAANTYTGDTFVNNGTLRFAQGGSADGSTIRIGDTSGTAAATLSIVDADGGTTLASLLNPRAGSSGLKTISATNTSGTNTFSGNVFLDADVTTDAASGGTLAFTGATFDLKNQTLTVGGAGNTTLSGTLQNSTGSGKLTKTGTGTLTLTGANTYAGATTVSAGILRVQNAAALGSMAAGTTVAANAHLDLDTVTVTGETVTISGPGDNQGALQGVNGTTSTWAGPVVLGSNSNTRIGTASTANTILVVSGVIDDGPSTFDLNVRNGGTGPASNLTAISGANTYGGATNVLVGTLRTAANNTIPSSSAVVLGTGTNSGAIDLFGTSQTLPSLTVSGTGTVNRVFNNNAAAGSLTLNIAGANTYAGILGNTGQDNFGLTKTGAGTLSLSGANTFTGGTTIKAGTVISNVAGALGASGQIVLGDAAAGGDATLNYAGSAHTTTNATGITVANAPTGTLTLNTTGGSSFVNNAPITLNHALVVAPSSTGSLKLGGAIGGAGALSVPAGSGTLTLTSGGSDFSSGLAFNGAELRVDASSTPTSGTVTSGPVGTGTLSLVAGATIRSDTAARAVANPVTLGGGLTFGGTTTAANLTLNGTVALPAATPTLTVSNAAVTATLGGDLTGAAGVGLVKSGPGTLTLAGTGSTFTGGVAVNDGVLAIGASSTPTSGTVTSGPLGTGTLTAAAGLTIQGTGAARTIANPVSPAGDLVVGGTASTNNLTLNGTLALPASTPTLTVTSSSVTATLGGGVSGGAGVGLTKAGPGVLVLGGGAADTAANTYPGLTTVSAGTLSLNKAPGTDAVAGNLSVTGGTASLVAGNQIKDASSADVSGTGTVDLAGKNETFANLTISGGGAAFTFNGGNASHDLALTNLTVGGTAANPLTINASGIVTVATNTVFTGTSGANVVQMSSGGTARRTELRTGTGGLSFTTAATTFQLNASTATAGSRITLNGNLTVDAAASGSQITVQTGTANGTREFSLGAATRTFDIADGANAVDFTLNGQVVGTGVGFTKVGAGVLSLGNTANNYTGTTTVNAGSLQLGAAGVIPDAGAVSVGAAGTFDLNSKSETVGTFTLAGGGVVANTGGTAATLTASAANLAAFSFQNASTPSTVTVALSSTTTTNVGVTFDATNNGTATLNGGVNLNSSATAGVTRTFTVNNGTAAVDMEVPGVVSNTTSTGLAKAGAGTLRLSSPTGNTYGGTTTVNAGTLQLSNASNSATGAGAVTLNNAGSTLASVSAATVSGLVTANAGTIVAPGDVGAVGSLMLNGGLTTVSGAALNFDVPAGPGTSGNDLLTVGGTFTNASGTLIGLGSGPTATGNYRLIGYTTLAGPTTNFVLPTPPAGFTYNLSSAVDPGFLDLVVGTTAGGTFAWNVDGDGTWGSAANWSPNTSFPDGAGHTATFGVPAAGNAAATATVALDGTRTVGLVNFANAARSYTIAAGTGGTLILNNGSGVAAQINVGDATPTAGGSHQISAPVQLSGSAEINVYGAGDVLTLSGPVSGSLGTSGIAKAGAGTLALSGTNTYAGTTTINAGTVAVSGGNAIADAAAVALANAAGVTLAVNGGETIGALSGGGTAGGTVALGANTLTVNQSTNTTYSGATSGTGGLVKGGGGTLTLATSLAHTGPTSIDQGTLAFTGTRTLAGALNFGSTNAVATVGSLDSSGGDVAVGGAFNVQTNTTNANTLTVGPAQTLNLKGNVVIGTGLTGGTSTTLNATGGGTLVVENTATPPTLFQVGGQAPNATAGTGNRAVADFGGLGTLVVKLNPGTGVFRVNPTSGANTVNKFSTLTLPSTGAGNTTITANVLAIGDGAQNASGGTGTNSLRLGTGVNTFNVNTINIGSGANGRDGGQLLFNTASGSVVIHNTTTPTPGRTALNIATQSTNTGQTHPGNVFDVSGHAADLLFGAVEIGTQPRTVSYTNTFSFDRGTLDMTSLVLSRQGTGAFTTATTVNLGSASSTAADTAAIQNGVTEMATNTFAGGTAAATINIAGGTNTIGNTAGTSLSMAGASAGTANATLNITGGVTTLTGNVVRVGGAGTTTATLTLDGGALNMGGNSIGAPVTGNPLVTNFKGGTLTAVNQINQGTTGLVKTTAGTLTLGGTNTYTNTVTPAATTRIDGGVLAVSADANLGAAGGGVTINDGTLRVTAGYTSASRTLTLGHANSAIDVAAAQTFTVSNAVVGAGGLTKSGAGTLALAADNGYGGGTTVAAGTLLANNTAGSATGAGAVNVNAGGTLGGAGTVGNTAGPVSVNAGGTLAPGNGGVGVLTTGSQTWAAGGTYEWEIVDPNATGGAVPSVPGAGVGWDMVELGAGTLAVAADGTNPPASRFTIRVVRVGGVAVAQGQWFTVARTNNPVSGFAADAFILPDAGGGPDWQARVQDLTAGGGGFQLQVSPTPEPGAAGLLAAAAVGLLGRRRRRRVLPT